jgi:hypothetical protein
MSDKASGDFTGNALATVVARKSAGGVSFACVECVTALGRGETGYSEGAARVRDDLAANFTLRDPVSQIGVPAVFRRYLCPHLSTRLRGRSPSF